MVWAGEWAISSAVITVEEAPTMPLNWRLGDTSLAGETLGLLVAGGFGAGRDDPEPSSVIGLARVRV
jgi:hypothetical protein